MEITIKPDYDAVCEAAAGIICQAWERKNKLVLGMATGKTPLGLYQRLAALHRSGQISFSSVVTFNMDEYLGLEASDHQSFAYYMEQNLFRHLDIKKENIFFLSGKPADIEKHCQAYERKIRSVGGIDVQILGIGGNGHIGFNEPGSSLTSRTRLKALTPETIETSAEFFRGRDRVPRFCLTMGIGTILEAKRLLLLASGEAKAEVVRRAVEGPVTAFVPASALQLHPRLSVILDEAAASGLVLKEYYRFASENKEKAAFSLKREP
jgi:glucosamine-6-phosphate deaminase